jgi:hypothetical protein
MSSRFARSLRMGRAFFLAACIGPLLASPAVGQNLLTNPSFTAGIAGWNPYSSSMKLTFRPDVGSILPGGSGPGSVEVRVGPPYGGGSLGAIQEVPVLAGLTYGFAASYYAPSAGNAAINVVLGVRWYDSAHNTIKNSYVHAAPHARDAWTSLSGSDLAPAGTVNAQIFIGVGLPSYGSSDTRDSVCLFDDAELKSGGGVATTSQSLFLPVAASKAGSGGTFWTTDLWVYNATGYTASLSLALLVGGQDNTGAVAAPVQSGLVPPHGFLKLTDVVATLGKNVTGALLVVATVEAASQAGPLVVLCSRNATPATAGLGSYGQAVAGVPAGTSPKTVAPGVFVGSANRTNVCVLNTSGTTIDVLVEILDGNGNKKVSQTWRLLPYEPRMPSASSLGVSSLDGGTVVFALQSTSGSYRGFISVVDNSTGDSVFVAAQ